MIYDLAIIGGGPAGYSAAFESAKLGLSTLIFEGRDLGGTCLNRGCVPTKFYSHVAELFSRTAERSLGISANSALDFPVARQRCDEIVTELREGLRKRLLSQKIELVDEAAEMLDGNHLRRRGGVVIETKNILIATGSLPAPPPVAGALTSDEMLRLETVPKSVGILGAGVIGVEFANFFHGLGAETTLYLRGDRILRKWDKELALGLTSVFGHNGIRIRKNCNFGDIDLSEHDVVLSAAGRIPNTAGVALSLVDLDDRGAIIVSDEFRTKTPNIFAVGDVIHGSPMLAHTAMEQARRAVRIIACNEHQAPSAVVSCIYTKPEIASVGLTETQAKDLGIEAVSAKRNLAANARNLIEGTERSFIKVLARKEDGAILGAQLMCDRACDIADEFVLAINNGLTVRDMSLNARPHPSFCETITEVLDALAEKVYGV